MIRGEARAKSKKKFTAPLARKKTNQWISREKKIDQQVGQEKKLISRLAGKKIREKVSGLPI